MVVGFKICQWHEGKMPNVFLTALGFQGFMGMALSQNMQGKQTEQDPKNQAQGEASPRIVLSEQGFRFYYHKVASMFFPQERAGGWRQAFFLD